MLKVAYQVNNLSDARYFAAYGFDWIIFDFGPGGFTHRHLLHGIAEWISGAQIGITVYSKEELAYFSIDHPEIEGYYLGANLSEDLPSDKVLFIPSGISLDDNNETFHIVTSYSDIYPLEQKYLLDITDLDPDATQIDLTRIAGICLAGDDEDRPGFKNFARQDRWIDIITE